MMVLTMISLQHWETSHMTTRRSFLLFLAPLAVLPVVGPHMLLSERPKVFPGFKAERWTYLKVNLKDGRQIHIDDPFVGPADYKAKVATMKMEGYDFEDIKSFTIG